MIRIIDTKTNRGKIEAVLERHLVMPKTNKLTYISSKLEIFFDYITTHVVDNM